MKKKIFPSRIAILLGVIANITLLLLFPQAKMALAAQGYFGRYYSPEPPVVPLIPPLTSLPELPGVGNSRRVLLNLGEGAGPTMIRCLSTTLNDILGPDWLYQGQSTDGGGRLKRATDIISFYPIEASTSTTYGLGQGFGTNLRITNPLSVITVCGTFLTAPALYNLGEFGALLNADGLTVLINAQGPAFLWPNDYARV